MLREEQIDIRRKRAAEEEYQIQNIGRNPVFSDYQVTNPQSGGQYRVSIRGFDIGDNVCSCPDYQTNTLGTCKHVEAILSALREENPDQLQQRKATVTRPEIYLHYKEQLRPGIHLPPRISDELTTLVEKFFDAEGLWKGEGRFDDLIEALDQLSEEVTLYSDARDFMERSIEKREMLQREKELVAKLDAGKLELDLLTVPLYKYQLRGALFAAYRGRCILGDDMGLGKTVQTLAAAELMAKERGIERVLVVAPASVKYQWRSEIERFTNRSVQVIEGNQEERNSLYAQPTFYRLINYELVLRDLDAINAWHPDLIVLDEAQRIKNWESKISRAVKKLRSPFALVLTGTPLENKLEELYSIVQFVDDRHLGPAFQFLHDHRVLDENGKLQGYRNLDSIREKLEAILLRRTRKEVLGQLPERTDTTLFVEMSEEQHMPYAEQQQTLARLLQKKYLTEVDRRRILACLTNMRMLCDSTWLYDKQTNISPKLEEFSEVIHELTVEGSHKVVVFSQWEMMLRKAGEVLEKLEVGYAMLHGSVPTKDRSKLLDRFRDEEPCRVFLSTDAGGSGLNLQVADTVINLEPPWNPAVLEQRIARVHRLGQHRPVQVFNLITRDSIEEKVRRTLEQKQSLFESVFEGTNNEITFQGLNQKGFLDTVRDMVKMPQRPPLPAPPPTRTPTSEDPREKLIRAGVEFLEALAMVMASGKSPKPSDAEKEMLSQIIGTDANGKPVMQIPLPTPELQQRSRAALQTILLSMQSRP